MVDRISEKSKAICPLNYFHVMNIHSKSRHSFIYVPKIAEAQWIMPKNYAGRVRAGGETDLLWEVWKKTCICPIGE